MTTIARFTGDIRVTGDLQVDGNMPTLSRSDLAKDSNKVFTVPMTAWRVHDAPNSLLPSTPGNDDLSLVGTFATKPLVLSAGDLKAAGATTRYARTSLELPAEYVDGDTVTIRVSAGMDDNVADTSATVDIECYKSDRENGIGSDLCATAAQDCNSTTFANFDFTITPTGLSAGDQFDVRIALAVNDAASGSSVTAMVGAVERLVDIRG